VEFQHRAQIEIGHAVDPDHTEGLLKMLLRQRHPTGGSGKLRLNRQVQAWGTAFQPMLQSRADSAVEVVQVHHDLVYPGLSQPVQLLLDGGSIQDGHQSDRKGVGQGV
jgi:hypothetical protein